MHRNNRKHPLIFIALVSAILLFLTFAGTSLGAQWEVIDLTHKWENGMPVWMAKYDGISLVAGKDKQETYELLGGWWLYKCNFNEHTGTHMDAPAHRKEGLWKLDDIPLTHMFGKALVMDMRPYVRDRDAYMITMDDVREWEAKNGLKLSDVPGHGFVYIYTGWDKYWYDFMKMGSQKFQVPNFPGISGEVGKYIVEQTGFIAVGIDTLSMDPGPSKDFPAHVAILGHGKYILENLNNLEPIANQVVFAIHGPLKMKGGSGAPTRVWAIRDPNMRSLKGQLRWAENLDARFRKCHMWDMSNYIENQMHIWQGVFGGEYSPTGITTWINYDTAGGFWGQKVQMNEHTGTHIDSGSHRVEGKKYLIDAHPVSQFYGPAVIVDTSSYGPEDGDWILNLAHFKDWQSKHPRIAQIKKGDLPIFYLGWVDEWIKHVKGYEREKCTYHFPGVGPDLAEYLRDRGVDGVGTDVTSIDAAKTAIYGEGGPMVKCPTHVTLCEAGIWNCENMGFNLPMCLNTRGYAFFMTVPYIKGGSGGSTRVYYFEGLELPELEG
jgi:kynurenine formamidase